MKNIIIFTLIYFTFFQCKKNSTEPEPELQYWTYPMLDAVVISFRHIDSVQLDTIFAGKIQFRLDVARTVDEQLIEFPVWKDWVLGDVIIFTTSELAEDFDSTTNKFNHSRLDSILSYYELQEVEISWGNMFILKFPFYYNMRILSEYIREIEGIHAEVNQYGGPGICVRDIKLEITDNVYEFLFSEGGSMCRHVWEVHVVDDHIIHVDDWEW